MEWLSRDEFEACAAAYDRAVAADAGIDAFCSQTPWILSFHDAFHPRAKLWLARADEAFLAFAEQDDARGTRLLQPLEAMWGFASPLVGDGSTALLPALVAAAGSRGGRGTRLALHLSGMPRARERAEQVARMLGPRFVLRVVSATERYSAALDGGADAWLGRRSAKFRRNLRAAQRRVRAASIEFEAQAPASRAAAERCHARALAVEAKSWKAASGNGVDRGPMREFYAQLLPRLAERGALRALFATRGGADVGYLHGGLSGGAFRGLQFSFDAELSALGLGNALQAEMIARLCAEGVRRYDLGSQSAYKQHWAEVGLVTLGVLALER